MIVRILSAGTSFKGVAAYLTHDPDAKTAERVGWTHTLNLAHDHVPSAVDEMVWTARNAELLKQEAGVRAGGRATENTVKHLSLNWAPDETPSREHMIGTTEDFLRHMGWHEHQALLVAHEDKEFRHLHVALNTVHPETGLRLNDDFERRRAQEWALGYEREQGRIYCDQRLIQPGEREDGPTRPVWMSFKEKAQGFARDEQTCRAAAAAAEEKAHHPALDDDATWQRLKDYQRSEREAFFAGGKSAFADIRQSVYREVREEFRDRWADFYAARRDGADPEELRDLKAALIADQRALLEGRRDSACQELRDTRDGFYRDLLDQQRELRGDLRAHQAAGLDNALFLQQLDERQAGLDASPAFRDSAAALTAPASRADDVVATVDADSGPVSDGASPALGQEIGGVGGAVGASFGRGLFTVGNSLFVELMGERPAPRQPETFAAPGADPFPAAAEEAQRRQQREQEQTDDDWRRRQRSFAGD